MNVEHRGVSQPGGSAVDDAIHTSVELSRRVDRVAHGGVLEELLGEADDEDGAEEIGPWADGQPVAHVEDFLQ